MNNVDSGKSNLELFVNEDAAWSWTGKTKREGRLIRRIIRQTYNRNKRPIIKGWSFKWKND